MGSIRVEDKVVRLFDNTGEEQLQFLSLVLSSCCRLNHGVQYFNGLLS